MTEEKAIDLLDNLIGMIEDNQNSDYDTALKKGIKALEKQSTTKNKLGVDCIDRAELLKAMDTWDKFGYLAQYGLERLDKDDKDFVPYVKYDDMVKCVKSMTSVTPIRPKGHWIGQKKIGFGEWKECIVPLKDGFVTDSCSCSECGDWLTGSDEYQCSGNFCPNCGADMRGVEE